MWLMSSRKCSLDLGMGVCGRGKGREKSSRGDWRNRRSESGAEIPDGEREGRGPGPGEEAFPLPF